METKREILGWYIKEQTITEKKQTQCEMQLVAGLATIQAQ